MIDQSIYSGPVFEIARKQFVQSQTTSTSLQMKENGFSYRNAITVSCPIHRDDGRIAVFQGYRVRHHLILGPTKGGTRFAPSVDVGVTSCALSAMA